MGAAPDGSGTCPSLRAEDRTEFARVVDEALRSEFFGRELREAPDGTAERLRRWAHASADELAGAAAAEYRALLRARAGGPGGGGAPSGSPGRISVSPKRSSGSTAQPSGSAAPASGARRERHRIRGGGLLAALAILVPLVATAAAVIFLVLGYVLMLLDTQREVGASLVVTGWSGAAIAAVTGALGLGKLVLTARRHSRSGVLRPGRRAASGRRAVETAHEAWRTALRERAVLPYLRERLPEASRADPSQPTAADPDPAPSGPRFDGPAWGSPDFASPDYGSYEYESPDFASPDYDSPGFGNSEPDGPGRGR